MEERSYLLIPKVCPKCGGATTVKTEMRSGVKTLWCTNSNCGESKTQNLSHFVSRDAMNIVGLSEETIRTLMDVGVINSMSDILRLEEWRDALFSLDGFGEKKIDKLLDAIDTAKEVKLENFIYALGIQNVGLQTAKLIARYCEYELDNFRILEWIELVNNIEGIGPVIADSVSEWLSDSDNQAEIDEMLACGLTIVGTDRTVGSSLAGMVFCCTGSVNIFSGRNELKNYIESKGGKLTGSVSANTNYLVTNDTTTGTAKNRAADALGVPKITEAQFVEMFGK